MGFGQGFLGGRGVQVGLLGDAVGQDRAAVFGYFGEAAGDEVAFGAGAVFVQVHQPAAQAGDQLGVAGQDAEVALGAGDHHHLDVAVQQQAFRADDFERHRHGSDPLVHGFGFLHCVLDGADHVERRFRQVVVLAIDDGFEASR